MIHADHGVELGPRSLMEQAVGRGRTPGVDAELPQRRDRRSDDLHVLTANRPIFARVRIEAGNGEARSLDPEVAAQGLGRHHSGINDLVHAQQSADLRQRLMNGDQRGAEALDRQHHDRTAGALVVGAGGEFAQKFGVAWKLKAGLVERRLGDWGGDEAANRAGERQADAGFDPADDGGGGGRRGLARNDRATERDV